MLDMANDSGLFRNSPEPSAEFPQSSAEVPQSSADFPQPSAEVPQSSAEFPQSLAEVPQSLGKVREPSGEFPQPSGKVPDSSAKVREPLGDFRESNPALSETFPDTPAAFLPLYEAKMIHQFDHRYATYQGATEANLAEGSLPQPLASQKADPDFTVKPRYWVEAREVLYRTARVPEDLIKAVRAGDNALAGGVIQNWVAGWLLNNGKEKEAVSILTRICTGALSGWLNGVRAQTAEREMPLSELDRDRIAVYGSKSEWLEVGELLIESHTPKWFIGFRRIAPITNERTAIFSLLPQTAVGDNVFLMLPTSRSLLSICLLTNANCLVFDYTARQKMSGFNMNFYVVRQLPMLPPHAYTPADIAYIAPRVLELVYTSWDMKPFAEDIGYDGDPFVWNDSRRALLRAELDAYYARLYGLTRKQLRYILDPHGLSDRELEDILDPWEDPTCSGHHLLPENPTRDFPGETFRVLKNSEEKPVEKGGFGEYRTRRLVLEAWARLEAELGTAVPVNYREMLEQHAPPLAEKPVVTRQVPDELDLVAPGYTPKQRMDFRK